MRSYTLAEIKDAFIPDDQCDWRSPLVHDIAWVISIFFLETSKGGKTILFSLRAAAMKSVRFSR